MSIFIETEKNQQQIAEIKDLEDIRKVTKYWDRGQKCTK